MQASYYINAGSWNSHGNDKLSNVVESRLVISIFQQPIIEIYFHRLELSSFHSQSLRPLSIFREPITLPHLPAELMETTSGSQVDFCSSVEYVYFVINLYYICTAVVLTYLYQKDLFCFQYFFIVIEKKRFDTFK